MKRCQVPFLSPRFQSPVVSRACFDTVDLMLHVKYLPRIITITEGQTRQGSSSKRVHTGVLH